MKDLNALAQINNQLNHNVNKDYDNIKKTACICKTLLYRKRQYLHAFIKENSIKT